MRGWSARPSAARGGPCAGRSPRDVAAGRGRRPRRAARGIRPCIPPRAKRKTPARYKLRHRIENMFAKLKDWRRIATRYDRCAHTFFSAICLAATIIFWIS